MVVVAQVKRPHTLLVNLLAMILGVCLDTTEIKNWNWKLKNTVEK